MKATITSIELEGPFMKQLKSTNYMDFKKRGFWTKHYTMTLWRSENEIKKFASSGAHKEAIRNSKRIAKEIRTITIDADELPSWSVAKKLLKKGKVIRF